MRKISTIAYGAVPPPEMPSEMLINEWGLQPDSYYIVVCRLEPENHVLEIIEGFERSKSNWRSSFWGMSKVPMLT